MQNWRAGTFLLGVPSTRGWSACSLAVVLTARCCLGLTLWYIGRTLWYALPPLYVPVLPPTPVRMCRCGVMPEWVSVSSGLVHGRPQRSHATLNAFLPACCMAVQAFAGRNGVWSKIAAAKPTAIAPAPQQLQTPQKLVHGLQAAVAAEAAEPAMMVSMYDTYVLFTNACSCSVGLVARCNSLF